MLPVLWEVKGPRKVLSRMDVRRRAAYLVLERGLSVSAASRECGLSRATVRLWLERAREEGVAGLSERSRRPLRTREPVDTELELMVLSAKAELPAWGAKKLVAHLWGADPPLCVRTADRILARHGLVRGRSPMGPMRRFERGAPNELWQMDFKGVGRRLGYSPLSVLDDASRFCLGLLPVRARTPERVWDALWGLFGRYGLPEAVLTDHEGCFAAPMREGPSWLEARLWRVGVRALHGRPAHPQTQGKVERFHRTLKEELGQGLLQPTPDAAREVYARFVDSYNWERPHEAIAMRVPGELYSPSPRPRPHRLPEPELLGECRKGRRLGQVLLPVRALPRGQGAR